MTVVTSNGQNLPAVMQPDQIDRGDPARPVAVFTIQDIQTMARYVGHAGMFSMNEAQAFALMMLCQADGLHPMHAVRRYHILKAGTPAMRAETMLAEMQARGWMVRWLTKNNDQDRQEALFRHAHKEPDGLTVEYTAVDAERADLLSGPNAATWRKHRPNMLRARVISNACRMLEPGILAGVYSTDEAEEIEATRSPRRPVGRVPNASPLRSALDAAKQPTARDTPAIAPPPSSRLGDWLETRLAEVHAQWSEIARAAAVDPGKPISRQQVANHLVKTWINDGTLTEDAISTGGRRDKHKVAAVLSQAWDGGPDELRSDVEDYLRAELIIRAQAAGITLPGEPELLPSPDVPGEREPADTWELSGDRE